MTQLNDGEDMGEEVRFGASNLIHVPVHAIGTCSTVHVPG
jgi:hypothetical protein